MRDVPAVLSAAWHEGLFIGDRKPIARVTVQHPRMYLRNYSLMTTFTETTKVDKVTGNSTTTLDPRHGHRVNQTYADLLFTKLNKPMELPNVKSVSWERTIDSDVAECTVTVWNTKPLDIGETPYATDLDSPGYYTYNRGGAAFETRWASHHRNPWFGMLVPDNIIRTYEGYGFDPEASPEADGNLVQTGVWLIDSVVMSTTGTMTIKCRDLGRILLDQLFYLPVVPADFYDNDWENWDGTFPGKPATNKLTIKALDSSNTPWIGSGTVRGHKLSYAFDGDPNSYWLSIGNDRPSRRFAYEWVSCTVGGKSVRSVKFRTKKKGYDYYISVKVGGVWQGTGKINYHEDGIGKNGADVNYVATGSVGTEGFIEVTLPKTYAKVQAVRLTLGNLQDFHIGTYHYRAGIRDVQVYGPAKATTTGYTKGPAGSNPGKYDDYTDIIKLICAWAGFFWPDNGKQRYSDGTYHMLEPATYDKVLGKGVRGRVWGDFMQSGVSGPAPLDRSNFDKKPLMDGIAYIRDILGFVFFIDETGGVQWRLPNVYNNGCVRSFTSLKTKYNAGFAHLITEKSVILSLDCTIDSRNVREAFFVGDVDGKIGAFAPGFNPNPTGLRRMAGWTDEHFGDTDYSGTKTAAQNEKDAYAQCQLMADMLSLRQLFTYRTDRIRIPANPAIQVDDQVRIFERVTSEGYIHYVKGISSSLDMSTGEWTYDLDTHWLGESPGTEWLFKLEQLHPVTQTTLEAALASQRLEDDYSRLQEAMDAGA